MRIQRLHVSGGLHQLGFNHSSQDEGTRPVTSRMTLNKQDPLPDLKLGQRPMDLPTMVIKEECVSARASPCTPFIPHTYSTVALEARKPYQRVRMVSQLARQPCVNEVHTPTSGTDNRTAGPVEVVRWLAQGICGARMFLEGPRDQVC